MESKSILLVEDDVPLRELIKGFLERGRYRVLEASGHSEVVVKLNNPIDLAIVDYQLPDKDGLEVVRTIRQAKPQLPIILATGYSTESLAIRAVRAGVTDYIKKPFTCSFLLKRVTGILCGERNGSDANGAGNRKDLIIEGIGLYIQEHYREDLKLNDLAKRACMSRFRLSRAFKDKFGHCCIQYLKDVRITNAMELLRNAHLNITEVAYFVGFKTLGHFDRMFKEIVGMSPREFRKKLQPSGDSPPPA